MSSAASDFGSYGHILVAAVKTVVGRSLVPIPNQTLNALNAVLALPEAKNTFYFDI